MAEHGSPPKKDVARALLLRGSLFVYLDPRRDGVRVPAWFGQQAQLVLQVGLDLPLPIPDLRVDDAGVYGTLSFNRAPFTCVVPWDAVFALMGDDGKGFVWAEDMPPEVAAEVDQAARRESREQVRVGKPGPASATPKKDRPRLRAIEGGATESGEMTGPDTATDETDRSEPKRPPHLRRIK